MDVSANDLKRIRTEQINEFKKKKHEETINLIFNMFDEIIDKEIE